MTESRGSLPLPARGEREGVRGIAGVTRWSVRLFLELLRRLGTAIAEPDSRARIVTMTLRSFFATCPTAPPSHTGLPI